MTELELTHALDYLEQIEYDALKKWVTQFLEWGRSDPLYFTKDPRDIVDSYDIISEIFKKSSENLKGLIKNAITNLITVWDVDDGSPVYFRQLLSLIGLLKIDSAYSTLLSWAKRENGVLKGRPLSDSKTHLKRQKGILDLKNHPEFPVELDPQYYKLSDEELIKCSPLYGEDMHLKLLQTLFALKNVVRPISQDTFGVKGV